MSLLDIGFRALELAFLGGMAYGATRVGHAALERRVSSLEAKFDSAIQRVHGRIDAAIKAAGAEVTKVL
jgi:BMFP domain-containing protein YqiC